MKDQDPQLNTFKRTLALHSHPFLYYFCNSDFTNFLNLRSIRTVQEREKGKIYPTLYKLTEIRLILLLDKCFIRNWNHIFYSVASDPATDSGIIWAVTEFY